jgi:hypothetical protein
MVSIGDDDDKKKKGGEEDVLDLSQLAVSDDGSEIDTGVTSGADSSDWDPITIDSDKNSAACAGVGSASASSKSTPAACGVRQQ